MNYNIYSGKIELAEKLIKKHTQKISITQLAPPVAL